MPDNKNKKKSLCVTEVLTTRVFNGVGNRFAKRYIVIARSPSAAIGGVPLADGEEILEAKELTGHTLIVVK